MNRWMQSTFGISAAGLLIVLAANLGKLVDAAAGAWVFLLTLANTAPLGVSSFALAFALAVAAQPFLRKWLPAWRCAASREFVVESAALGIGVAVMWAQTRTLSGLLLGILAGFAAPYAQKAIAAAGALLYRATIGERDPEVHP